MFELATGTAIAKHTYSANQIDNTFGFNGSVNEFITFEKEVNEERIL